ncbi:MAG TPA: VWA domain-containing protein [Herpetosiphon sp.]|uniref:von Willebrand factor type A n=1 Tax=Herpetosiphon aurantiacus (strain ATCC 23779 / DSM 785 / 114-95) TaxID=316274 RepID=A9AUC9_HERA2|nr:VWA domain-containing protein [Herpetosiphon sp.]ABX03048.1 von Willebrand factor type A [Herpetosiphon aurantiacus DSM 785]HBW50849.1 VWA domain-containing protein [Herpetosiphon sp.]
MSALTYPSLPSPFEMIGPCGKQSTHRRFFMAKKAGIPYLIWWESRIPEALRKQQMVVQIANQAGSEVAILDVQALSLQQLLDTAGSLPAPVAAQYALGLIETAEFNHRQRTALTTSNLYGPSLLDLGSQGTIVPKIDPRAGQQAGPVPAQLLPINEPASPQTDSYYIGALIAWMISGQFAPQGNPLAMLPAIDGNLRSILQRATVANPSQRPSAQALGQQIQDWLSGKVTPVAKKKPSQWAWLAGAITTAAIMWLVIYGLSRQDKVTDTEFGQAQIEQGTGDFQPGTSSNGLAMLGDIDGVEVNRIDDTRHPEIDMYLSIMRPTGVVTDVPRQNVKVFENNNQIEGFSWVNLSRVQDPLNIMLVIDTSGSMGPSKEGLTDGGLDAAKIAALDFIDHLPSNANVGLIHFGTLVTVDHSLTNDIGAVRQSISELKPEGQTAIYDALAISYTQLRRAKGQTFIVLISDGADTASKGDNYDSIVAKATKANIPTYIIGLTSPEFDGQLLEDLQRDTKAMIYQTPSKEQLGGFYTEVAQEVSGQYRASFNIPDTYKTGDEIMLKVEVNAGDGLLVTKERKYIHP